LNLLLRLLQEKPVFFAAHRTVEVRRSHTFALLPTIAWVGSEEISRCAATFLASRRWRQIGPCSARTNRAKLAWRWIDPSA
jgi:hypothetical protein